MTQEITNFARFYALFNRLPYTGDREELKRQIVREYTSGRTESLREMTKSEYNTCCAGMEKLTGRKDEMKKLHIPKDRTFISGDDPNIMDKVKSMNWS